MSNKERPKLPVTESWRRRMSEAIDRPGSDVTQDQIAARLGVDQASISYIKTGKTQASELVGGISEILGIVPSAICIDTEDELRWIEAGRVLRAKYPTIYTRHLRNAIEAVDDIAADLGAMVREGRAR